MCVPSFISRRALLPWGVAGWLAALGAPVLAATGIEAPIGGWRFGEDGAPYTQEVNYPASQVNLDGRVPVSAQIKGRISQLAKARKPATLVVNGTAMPLAVDESGSFGRPYAFPAGSNSVEIRGEGARSLGRVQFYEANAQRPQARLRVVLSWDSPGTDLDLHVVSPRGEHAWYGNRVVASGALDVDVTTGYGPEIFSSPAPIKGSYLVYVNYFGSGEQRGMVTTARVTVIYNEGTPSERRQEFMVPMRTPGDLTLVKQFSYP